MVKIAHFIKMGVFVVCGGVDMADRVGRDNQILDVYHISNRAADRIDVQVHDIAKDKLMIGVDKAQYIKDNAADYRAQNGLSDDYRLTAHDKGQISGLHSWDEYHKFSSCVKGFAHYCKAEFNIKTLSDITPSMVTSFCAALSDLGYSKNTVNGYLTQVEKLGAFTGNDFHGAIKDFKCSDDYKTLEIKDIQTRAYDAPRVIIDKLSNIGSNAETVEKTQLSAQLSLDYGLRASDCCHFKCIGNNQIFYNSKNGMKTVKTLAPQDYARAQSLAGADGKYNLSVNTLKDCWSRACSAAGVANNGLHGLRHSFAQNLYTDLTVNKGLSHRSACLVVSHEMNHSRPEITETYLR